MKRTIKRNYDEVKLTTEGRQKILKSALDANRKTQCRARTAWKIAGVAAAAAAVVLVVVLALTPGGQPEKTVADAVQTPAQTTGQMATAQATAAPDAQAVAARVVLALNPSVEFRLGEDGLVIEVVGLNEDGQALVSGIDFTGLSLENATILVVNQLILQEYITAAEVMGEIRLSYSGDMTADTLTVMTGVIEQAAAAQNISVGVAQAEDGALTIGLTGQGEPDVIPELEPAAGPQSAGIGLELEFLMKSGTHSAYVDGILFHGPDDEAMECMVDEADMRLGRAALRNIMELIEKGYICDEADAGGVRFTFPGGIGSGDIEALAELTRLVVAEYDLKISVTADTGTEQILLVPDATVTHAQQSAKFALRDVLSPMVNKDEADLSPRQITILKSVYTYREYQRLLEKRYFVVIPNLVGMTEQQAVDLLAKNGLVPMVVREKVSNYDPDVPGGLMEPGMQEHEDEGEASPGDEAPQTPMAEPTPPRTDEQTDDDVDTGQPKENQSVPVPQPVALEEWEYPVVGFGCVFYQDGPAGLTCQTGMAIQLNVIVSMDDERPEVSDYRAGSGIVLREMDVPFDVSGYPDEFSLSGAAGFDAMIRKMNATYTIEDAADYTVTIDRNTGWEGTAVITISHKDGFPQSKFFVQNGRIVEHEFLWRRDAPTAEDMG